MLSVHRILFTSSPQASPWERHAGNGPHCFSECTCKRIGYLALTRDSHQVLTLMSLMSVVFSQLYFRLYNFSEISRFCRWWLFLVLHMNPLSNFCICPYTIQRLYIFLCSVSMYWSHIPTTHVSLWFGKFRWTGLGVYELLETLQLFNWVFV